MAKNNQEEKHQNPLLTSLLSLFCAIVLFSITKTHDLEVFLLFTIPGEIVFPIAGVLLVLVSFFQFKAWLALRKERKNNKSGK